VKALLLAPVLLMLGTAGPGFAESLPGLFPGVAAERAPIAQSCKTTDLEGQWLLMFEQDDATVACLVSLTTGGGIRNGICYASGGGDNHVAKGKLRLGEDCQVLGRLTIEGFPKKTFGAHLSRDKTSMIGLLQDDDRSFTQITATRWVPN
jgi:hypothetical protein